MSGEKLTELAGKTERLLLAAWYFDAKFRAGWQPDPDLFSLSAHKALAESMARVGVDADETTLIIDLNRNGALKHFNDGADGVTDLLHGTPAVTDPWVTVQKLRELKALRALRHSLLDAIRTAESTCDLSGTRKRVSEALQAAMVGTGTKATTIREAFRSALTKATKPDKLDRSVSTGAEGVDKATGGIRRRNVWTIAAESNWGKTAWLISLAQMGRSAGLRPLVVRGEDPEELYAQRWMALLSEVEAWKFRNKELKFEDIQKATQVVQKAPEWPCFIDGVGKRVEELAADITSLVASDEIGLVLVDYLQCFRSSEKHQDRRNEVMHMWRVFAEAIKRSNAAGVIFSQVTKDNSGKPHVRDCEDVRNFSDVLLIGMSEMKPEEDHYGNVIGEREQKYFYVDKVKDGPSRFRVDLEWAPQFAAFQRSVHLANLIGDEFDGGLSEERYV
jgi:replicative DNA helicase